LDEVARRRKNGPCQFALLIPDVADRKRADWTLDNALPLLQRAAGGPVDGIVGGADPLTSVADAVRDGHFDEIIVSTMPKKTSKWLRRDLVRKIEGLGLPATAVTTHATGQGFTDRKEFDAGTISLGGGGTGILMTCARYLRTTPTSGCSRRGATTPPPCASSATRMSS
jgi:hypothetical protein